MGATLPWLHTNFNREKSPSAFENGRVMSQRNTTYSNVQLCRKHLNINTNEINESERKLEMTLFHLMCFSAGIAYVSMMILVHGEFWRYKRTVFKHEMEINAQR